MSLKRFMVTVAVLFCAEFAAFAWRYDDLVYLTRPVRALASTPAERFLPRVDRALERSTLTRATLETIAQAAVARGDRQLVIRALSRIAHEYPAEPRAHVRLADAYREAGLLSEAAHAYRQALTLTESQAVTR